MMSGMGGKPFRYHEAMDRRRSLEAKIDTIKHEIALLGDLHPGSLSQQFNVCGTRSCRCKADPPIRHGPYHQLSFTWNGRSRSLFVRAADLPVVQEQLRTYARLRELVERWVDLSMELSRSRLKERRALAETAKGRRRPGASTARPPAVRPSTTRPGTSRGAVK
jgi:hypothetical protein